MSPTLELPPARRISAVLLLLMVALLGCSTGGQIAKYYLGHPQLMGFVQSFYVDYEANLPTWFSASLLALAGLLLLTIALAKGQQQSRYALHWGGLGLLFVALSADEIAGIHELPIDPIREAFGTGGLLYYGWVIPGALFVLAVAWAIRHFLAHLPQRTRRVMIAAALVYVGGAIGVEMLSGAQANAHGEENFPYALIVTVEEALEMLGVILLIHALVDYIHSYLGGLRLVFGATERPCETTNTRAFATTRSTATFRSWLPAGWRRPRPRSRS